MHIICLMYYIDDIFLIWAGDDIEFVLLIEIHYSIIKVHTLHNSAKIVLFHNSEGFYVFALTLTIGNLRKCISRFLEQEYLAKGLDQALSKALTDQPRSRRLIDHPLFVHTFNCESDMVMRKKNGV